GEATRDIEAEAHAESNGLGCEKGIEDPSAMLLGDTRAVIRDSNDDEIAVASRGDGDVSSGLTSGRIDRVVDQLFPNLIELATDAADRWQIVRGFDPYLDRSCARLVIEHRDRIGQTARDVDVLGDAVAVHEREPFDGTHQMVDASGRRHDLRCDLRN